MVQGPQSASLGKRAKGPVGQALTIGSVATASRRRCDWPWAVVLAGVFKAEDFSAPSAPTLMVKRFDTPAMLTTPMHPPRPVRNPLEWRHSLRDGGKSSKLRGRLVQ